MCGTKGYDTEQAVVLRLISEENDLLKVSFNVDQHQIVFSLTSQRLDSLGEPRGLQITLFYIYIYFFSISLSIY